jgi:hypothetical protein
MIETSLSKVKINEIIQSQIPEYIDVENPYFGEFLRQYYYSQEYQGGPVDIADNLVEYKGLDYLNTRNLIGFTSLTSYISGVDETIYVKSTDGWPAQWGLLKIDDEIITYTGIGSTSFTGCVRGFSGIEKNTKTNQPEYLTFTSSGISTHASNARVENLSNVFLNEFLKKLKTLVLPGFENRNLYGDLNESNFIRQAKDFYKSKGTEEAFKILFKALYAEQVEMVQPQKFVIKPSDADYIKNDVLVCEVVSGNPIKIEGQTLFQNTTPLQTSGSIYNVEKAIIDGKTYYKIAISKGTTLGKFLQVGKTFVTKASGTGSTIINVDSTVGFGTTGDLTYEDLQLSYTDKNYTQFLGVSGITTSVGIGSTVFAYGLQAYSYEDGNLDNPVYLNIVGTINNFNGSALNQQEGSSINVSTLGIEQKDTRFTSWIYNTSTKYIIDKINSLGSNVYEFTFFSTHVLYVGDTLDIVDEDNNITVGTILQIINNKTIQVNCASLDLSKKYFIRRQLKTNKDYTADIQNTYSSGDTVYVASNSIPHWNINPQKRIRNFTTSGVTTFTEISITDHHFNDGELVVYKPSGTNGAVSGLSTNQSYYIRKIDDNTISLAYSLENARRGQYISIFGSGDLSGITTHSLTPYNVGFSTIGAQKLLRKFPVPEYSETKSATIQGGVGLFVNGVEIYSYKSTDKVYYGPIQSVSVLNEGSNFDVINPPRLSVYQDGHSGAGSSVITHVSGSIQEILVDTEGLDYTTTPTVYISGGNGSASAEAKMKLVSHQVDFDSTSTGGIVDTVTDKITFPEAHGFKHGEEIVYNTRGTTPIGLGTAPGTLINGSSYYVIKNNDYTISLAETRQKALAGIATLDITSNGQGFHAFSTKERRLKVDKVYIIENGTFYNRENTTTPVGINTFTDVITINNHGYSSGEELKYSTTGLSIGGLSTTTKYYAIKINEDQFRVSISTSLTNYVGLSSVGSGYHVFNYPPIVVTLNGPQGITTANATVTPIVRGSISAVHVKDGGSDFGSTIINDNYKPEIRIIEGSNASLKPLIINGRLDSIIVKSGGSNYFSVPDIIIEGDGVGAKAKANVANGQIVSIDIIDQGAGYTTNGTTVTASTPGQGAIFSSNLKEWTVNQVERYAKIGDVKSDDGFYETVRNTKLGNPYVNYYVPRNLRSFLNDSGIQHSPILGYAYDGSPIYGPYAFTNYDGTGSLKYLQSSYAKISGSRVDGPNISQYPAGFFVEDFNYVQGSGDLDEYNGRFAITPEYPNGVYAYYTTVSSSVVNDNGSPFNGVRQPVFPYVIGNYYNFTPSVFNYAYNSTQDIDPLSLNLVRNTDAYKISNGYEFISNSNKNTTTQSKILNVKSGSVEKINIVESGVDYNVGDRVVFNNKNTSGFGAIAKVSKIVGVAVTNITSSITTLSNITLVCNNNSVTAISTVPHNLVDGSYVSVVGISSTSFNNLTGTFRINVNRLTSGLATSMLATGLTTSIQITDLASKFSVNDILKIDSEQFLIMGIDKANNKLNLLRNYNGTTGAAHTNRAEIVRLEKEFTYELDKIVSLSTPKNEVVFFDASSSVGVGLSYGVGIGTTISYIGAGNSQKSIFIPTRSIFLPDNPLIHGEEVFYSPGAGTSLTYSLDGSTTSPMPSKMYVQKLTKDLIALTNVKTGINSDLSRVFFNGNIGIGNSHSFTTRRNTVSSSVKTVDVVVSTASSHRLRPDDIIDFTVVSTATSSISTLYDPVTRFISIGSSINPRLDVTTGDYLEFDVSHASLLNSRLEFFLDQDYNKKFVGSGVSSLEITNQFAPGITSAKTTIHFTEQVPPVLYYKFTSQTSTKIIEVNKDVNDYSKIVVHASKFTGTHSLTTTTNQSFTFNVFEIPERVGYTSASYINYITNSTHTKGSIAKIDILDGGKNYKSLPSVSVASTTGSSAVLRAQGSKVGAIDSVQILDFGYDYPSDKTLQPQASVPQVILLKDNYSVDTVAITSTGSKYLTAPDVIVYNRETDTINTQVSIVASLSGSSVGSVSIINSGGNLKSTDNDAIAINNTNGVGIISATYSSPNVTLRLQTPTSGFTTSNPLPFAVGDQIFVENIGVSTGKGYNSSEYGYRYWTITGVNTAFGLINQATISYSVDEDPGIHDGQQYGSVSNVKNLATFTITLKEGEFFNGEEVYTNNSSVNVISGNDPVTNVLRVNSLVGLNTGDLLRGRTSGSSGIIESMQDYSGYFDVNSTISKDFGWEKDTGKLNDFFQRIQDSDYYQQFAYSLKSKVGISSWSEPVDSLAHIAGFKKHSDLLIPSDSLAGLGSTSISTGIGTQASTVVLVNPDPVKMYCKHDWDLVYEKTNDDATISDEIVFKSNRFGDALICKSNRVLEIDDISPQFYSDPNISRSLELDSFDITSASAIKYYAQVVLDTSLGITFNETQYTEFVVSHDGTISFNNQYSDISDAFDLGDFSTSISGTTVSILFSPYNTTYTYDLTFYKEKIEPGVGVGTTSFGHVQKVGVASFIAASGSPSSQIIQSIDANQFKSGSVIVSVIGPNQKNITEASFLGIGSTSQYIEFGKMESGVGLGTFSVDMTATNNLQLKWLPAAGVGVTVAMLSTLVGVATTVSTGIPGTSYEVGDASLNCTRTTINSSATPSAEIISTISSNSYVSIKYLVEIHNTTDNEYSFFHVAANIYGDVVNYIKYNNLSTSLDYRRDIQNIDMIVSGASGLLRFTPKANKAYIVRTSEIRIDNPDDVASDVVITLP